MSTEPKLVVGIDGTGSGDNAVALARTSAEALGARAHGPLRSAWGGSVSRPVVDQASCPVIVIPRGVLGAVAGASRPPQIAQAGRPSAP